MIGLTKVRHQPIKLYSFILCNFNTDFLFLVIKPITAKVKIIMNKSNEARVPKLLVDFVLQDAATQLTRQQYLCMLSLQKSFNRMRLRR